MPVRKDAVFPTIPRTLRPAGESRDVAVVGGDLTAVFVAAVLARRGHRVTWYRGADSNPRAGSGVLRIHVREPLALPGYVLRLPGLFLGMGVRGGMTGIARPGMARWLVRAVAASWPRAVEAIADDRSRLLAAAPAAFRTLLAVKAMESTDVIVLYRNPGDFAAWWAAHDVARRHGATAEEVEGDRLLALLPRTNAVRGVRIAGVPVVAEPETVLNGLKAALETECEVVRRWPERMRPRPGGLLGLSLEGRERAFSQVIRTDLAGPESLWAPWFEGGNPCIAYRERLVIRDAAPDEEPVPRQVLVDGASGAWLEHEPRRLVGAGAHRLGGDPDSDLRYLVLAAYARRWGELMTRPWREEGSRSFVRASGIAPDSRPLIGPLPGASNLLMAGGMGELAWTLGPLAGFAMAAFVEDDHAETAKYRIFAPGRFV